MTGALPWRPRLRSPGARTTGTGLEGKLLHRRSVLELQAEVFENEPALTKSDASGKSCMEVSETCTVFENAPTSAKSDASATYNNEHREGSGLFENIPSTTTSDASAWRSGENSPDCGLNNTGSHLLMYLDGVITSPREHGGCDDASRADASGNRCHNQDRACRSVDDTTTSCSVDVYSEASPRVRLPPAEPEPEREAVAQGKAGPLDGRLHDQSRRQKSSSSRKQRASARGRASSKPQSWRPRMQEAAVGAAAAAGAGAQLVPPPQQEARWWPAGAAPPGHQRRTRV